jgi:hypothetical protein
VGELRAVVDLDEAAAGPPIRYGSGWARRFVAISLAFTLWQSIALLVGAYELVPVPRTAIEILMAASIAIAAIHAIRPLFAGREWLVAAAFGTVHGLAFSESLAELTLAPWVRALAVGGFAVGVEAAQLVAMACAVLLLDASRWRIFHTVRVCTMVCAALVAGVWMLDGGQMLVRSQRPLLMLPHGDPGHIVQADPNRLLRKISP